MKEFKTENLSLYNMDCMELMKDTPDNYYDLAIVDPPYGIDAGNMNMGRRKGERVKHQKKSWDKNAPSQNYFDELKRVSGNQIIWGANYMIDKIKTPSAGWVFWDKMITGDVDFSAGELAYTSFNQSMKKDEIRIQSMYITESRIHPTQKPVKLYEWLLNNYAEKGQKILDTHLGSMSSAIACHYFGAHLTGCELDEDYFKAGVQRVEAETRQLTLF